MKNFVIQIKNLSKSYRLYEKPVDRLREAFSLKKKRYSSEKCVLNDISVNIEKGDVVGIVGTNGAGKSTLLKMVTGILTPSLGTINTAGKIAALLELGTGFNPEFSGIKNIYLNGSMMGFSHEEMERKVQSIIDFADIGDFISQPVKLYSSGMFARLAFAVAINVEPDILIVDETLSVGDMRFQIKCMKRMKQMMENGVTVLFVSHDINAIRRICTKCIWLHEGIMKLYGETNAVCDQYMDFLKIKELDNEVARSIQADSHQKDINSFSARNEDVIAEIAEIRLLNQNGKKVDNINIFEKFIVEIVYDVYDENIEAPVLGVALKRIDDEYICGVNTMLDEVVIPWRYGRNQYSLVYQDGLRVLGGAYYFDVAIFDNTATVPIHYWAKAVKITVCADYIGEGVCILPHRWGE